MAAIYGERESVKKGVSRTNLLADGRFRVVVSVERGEGGHLHPPVAELLVRVALRHSVRHTPKMQTRGRTLKPQVSAPTIGMPNIWNCKTPAMEVALLDQLL